MPADLTTAMVAVVALILQLDYPFRGEISILAEPFRQVLQDAGRTEPGACVRVNVEGPDPYHKVRRGNLSMARAGSSHCRRDTAS
jgi:hypothetical protein